MKIELLYVHDCPNHLRTAETVKDVLRENGLSLNIIEIEINNPAQAATFSFPGSPTVRVDGTDVEPGVSSLAFFGVSCRSYLVNGKRQGVPDREWIRQAVQSRQTE